MRLFFQSEIKSIGQAQLYCQTPPHWDYQKENLKLVMLDLNSEESKECIDLMKKTINPRVISIQRVQNIKLWRNYQFEKQKLISKGNADEMMLFHGTRGNNPELIYNGTEEGFDFRMSAHGSYGRGTYFHETASYSDGYAYIKGGSKIFFIAHVLVGKYSTSVGGSNLVAPPEIAGTNGLRYDSVRSNVKQGQNMFIIYHNSKAYPSYLIEYKTGKM